MSTPLILHAPAIGEGQPLPLGLEGYPNEIEGERCHYRRKELAKAGPFVHRGTRKTENIDTKRMDAWVDAFRKRAAKGLRPFVSDIHTLEPSAKNGQGYVVGLSRSGDSLYADLQLIGDEALKLAARNGISLCATADEIDADGVPYPEILHHTALTPSPALTNLGPFVKIAASAGGGPVIDAPVYAAEQENPMLKPETLTKLRQKLKLAADVKDEDVAEQAALLALTDPPADLSGQVTALSADKTRLETELATAKSEVQTATLALSGAQPKEPDPMSLSLMNRVFKHEREQLISSGALSEAGATELDKLLGVGSPKGIALSLSAGSTDPLYMRVCEIIRRFPGVKADNAVERAVPTLTLDGNGQASAATTTEAARAEAAKWQTAQLAARGLS